MLTVNAHCERVCRYAVTEAGTVYLLGKQGPVQEEECGVVAQRAGQFGGVAVSPAHDLA